MGADSSILSNPPSQTTPPTAPVTTPPVTTPPSWKDSLPETIRGEASLKAIESVDALAQSYINAQKMIGKDRIVVPNQNSAESEWTEAFKKLGLPETVDKYEVKADPEMPEEFLKQYKAEAHKAGVLPKQAQKLIDWFNTTSKTNMETQKTQVKQQIEKDLGKLKEEWGQAYEPKLEKAHVAAKHFGGDEFINYLKVTGLGNDAGIIKLFAKIGDTLGEDVFKGTTMTRSSGITPAEAKSRIGAIMSDRSHPYYLAGHANHAQAVAEVNALFQAQLQNS